MSSQRSSSIRIYSGAAFEPMAGDPLSREISTPSASSTKSTLEVISCPEPVYETASTSGHSSEGEEEDEVGNRTLRWPHPTNWRDHTLLQTVMLLCQRPTSNFGVRFPLHPFFVKVLEYFGLTLFQINPNRWAHMIGLFGQLTEHGMGPPTTAEFTWFTLSRVTRMTKASTSSPRDQ